MTWAPHLKFLTSGSANLKLSWRADSIAVRWCFHTHAGRSKRGQLIECTLQGAGKDVRGFATDFRLINTLRIALAEAWERFVFRLYREEELSPVQSRYRTTGYAAGKTALSAQQAAQEEYLERHLLVLAIKPHAIWQPYIFQGFYNHKLWGHLSQILGPTESYVFEGKPGQRVLFGWAHTQQGPIFDSVYLNTQSERTSARRFLLSLLGTSPPANRNNLQINPLTEKVMSVLGDCASLETRLVYPGGPLPPVALAFDPHARAPYLNQLSQDEIFASLFLKAHQSPQTKYCH